jgi:hypothetical protein
MLRVPGVCQINSGVLSGVLCACPVVFRHFPEYWGRPDTLSWNSMRSNVCTIFFLLLNAEPQGICYAPLLRETAGIDEAPPGHARGTGCYLRREDCVLVLRMLLFEFIEYGDY